MKVQTILSHVIILVFALSVNCQTPFLNSIRLTFSRKIFSPSQIRMVKDSNKLQSRIKRDTPFPCMFVEYMDTSDYRRCNKRKSIVKNPIDWKNTEIPLGRSPERPTSVHKLRPGDIDIIAAIGDSLTAGNGVLALNIVQLFSQNRGLSWSIGGQGSWREYLTIPNILKVFNPKLFGFSLGDSLVFENESQFNVAEVGAMSQDLLFMTKELIKRITNDKRVDLKNHWKFVTLMIGNNDFCMNFCDSLVPVEDLLKKHRSQLYEALKLLKEKLPRTMIHKVVTPSMKVLINFVGKPPICELAHMFECPCFFGEPNKFNRKKFLQAIEDWRAIDYEIINLPEFQDSDDFTIVNQPFLQDVEFPKKKNGQTDFSLMSEDCFHFSQKGYSLAVNSYWNNIMEPVGNKSTNWTPLFDKFLCPTIERPYIATNKNSFTDDENTQNNLINRKRSISSP